MCGVCVNQYDIALKSLLQRQLQNGFLSRLTGHRITEWLATELPEVRTRHVDLLGKTADGQLIHIEFQSRNDPRMALRMAEYALAIHRRYRMIPVQTVIYVGERPLRMPTTLTGPDWLYACRIVDIRDIPTEDLLRSPHLEDAILAVLTRLSDSRDTIRRILQRIGSATPDQRSAAIGELMLLAGLRQLKMIMKKELEQMSILIDINRHTIFGPIHREGVKEGMEKGLEKGMEEGARLFAVDLLTQRFGKLSPAQAKRIRSMNQAELATLRTRIFDAKNLKDLFA